MGQRSQKTKFLDVGHGDSSVIYLYDQNSGKQNVIIIDIVDAERLLEELEDNHVQTVDLIILSHSDEDHCRGVNDFLEQYMKKGSVKQICFSRDRGKFSKTMKLFLKKFCELYQKQRIDLLGGEIDTTVSRKQLIVNGSSKLDLLYPNMHEMLRAAMAGSTNNASLVCLLEHNACRILFTGDLEGPGWSRLLHRFPDLKCDVLKMPHHGAYYTKKGGISLETVLDTLQPAAVVISSGEHARYRHPAKETVEILNQRKIKVYCTEFTSLCHNDPKEYDGKCYGDIEVLTDGSGYIISGEVQNRSCLDHAVCGCWHGVR